jgi:hypothetical protein
MEILLLPFSRLTTNYLSTDSVKSTISNISSVVAYVSVAARTCLPSRYLTTVASSGSTIHIVPSLRLSVPSSLDAYRYFSLSEGGVPTRSTLRLINGTVTSYWSRRFFLQLQRRPVFKLRRLGLVLLFSKPSVLKAARLERHYPPEGAPPLVWFCDPRSLIIVIGTWLGDGPTFSP